MSADVAKRPFRVAVVQTSPRFGERAANREEVEALLASAPEFDLGVLPELALTGYQFRDRAEALLLSEPARGPATEWLAGLSRERGAILVAGLAERDGDCVYNAAIAVGPAGFVGTYRKVHLFYREKEVFDPGDLGFPTWDVAGRWGTVRLGTMVCFDWRFPEAMRSLALAGAEVVAHPSNLVFQQCPEAMITRCLENHVAAATANRIGTEDRWLDRPEPLMFVGRSQVVDARGRRVASLGPDETGVAMASIDLAASSDKSVTRLNDIIADRRPDAYRRSG